MKLFLENENDEIQNI